MSKPPSVAADKRALRALGMYSVCLTLAVLSISAIIAVHFNLIAANESVKDTILSIATGVLTSALLTPIFAYFVDNSLMSWISVTVADRFTHALNTIDAERSAHLPSHIFDSTLRFDPKFNQQMAADFGNCKFYGFHGQTSRYVALRIGDTRAPHFRQLCIRVPYPSLPATTTVAVGQRLLLRPFAGWSREKVYDSLVDDILLGLVGCFERVRTRSNVTMVLAPTNPHLSVRTEALDTACYVSLYDTSNAGVSAQPESIRYPAASMLHKVFYESDTNFFERVLRTASADPVHKTVDSLTCFVITGETERSEWTKILNAAGFEVDDARVEQIRLKFLEWEKHTLALAEK